MAQKLVYCFLEQSTSLFEQVRYTKFYYYGLLISAIKGERYSQQLSLDLDDAERLNLVEKLADVFSEVKSSEKALLYYQQQVCCSHILTSWQK